MKKKYPIASHFMLCIIFIFSSCKNTSVQTIQEPVKSNSILDGQYTVEFEYEEAVSGIKKEHIWIFKDDFMFMISPMDKSEVEYQIPVRFFVEQEKLFICSIRGIWDPMTIKECKDLNTSPSFEIMKIDTISDKNFEADKYQRIRFRNMMGTNETVTIKKILPR